MTYCALTDPMPVHPKMLSESRKNIDVDQMFGHPWRRLGNQIHMVTDGNGLPLSSDNQLPQRCVGGGRTASIYGWSWSFSFNSRRRLSCSRRSRANSRNNSRSPPHQALCEEVALPSAVVGPVLCSHGFHFPIISACRARRSGVQPFAMLHLQ